MVSNHASILAGQVFVHERVLCREPSPKQLIYTAGGPADDAKSVCTEWSYLVRGPTGTVATADKPNQPWATWTCCGETE
jgi:hypothetical protein